MGNRGRSWYGQEGGSNEFVGAAPCPAAVMVEDEEDTVDGLACKITYYQNKLEEKKAAEEIINPIDTLKSKVASLEAELYIEKGKSEPRPYSKIRDYQKRIEIWWGKLLS